MSRTLHSGGGSEHQIWYPIGNTAVGGLLHEAGAPSGGVDSGSGVAGERAGADGRRAGGALVEREMILLRPAS